MTLLVAMPCASDCECSMTAGLCDDDVPGKMASSKGPGDGRNCGLNSTEVRESRPLRAACDEPLASAKLGPNHLALKLCVDLSCTTVRGWSGGCHLRQAMGALRPRRIYYPGPGKFGRVKTSRRGCCFHSSDYPGHSSLGEPLQELYCARDLH